MAMLARPTRDQPITWRKRAVDASAAQPLHWAALVLFGLAVTLSISAVRLGIGPLPLRLLVLSAAGGCIALADWPRLIEAFHQSRRVIGIIVGVAVLGVFVSVLAAANPAAVAQQLFEIHIQALLTLVVTYALVLRFGVGLVLGCYIGAFALTALFALGQALGLDAAWQARVFTGRLMRDPPLAQLWYVRRIRPLGLSFSPVHVGTQACLVFAALFLLRFARTGAPAAWRRIDWPLIGLSMLLIAVCVATGNRSPLLGIAVFFLIYGLIAAPRLMLIALPLLLIGALLLPAVLESLSESGVRVARTTDGSSTGRATLRAYGLYLLQQRPIGYGLTFDSTRYWPEFAHQAIYMDNWLVFRQWPVHNYFLNILAKHGVLLLAVVPLLVPRTRAQAWMWLAFLPYLLHAFYHNEGPLQAEYQFFMILPAAMWLAHRVRQEGGDEERRRVAARPWRRAFADQAA